MLTTFLQWTAIVLLVFLWGAPAAPPSSPPVVNLLQESADSLPKPQIYDHMLNMRNRDHNDSMAAVFEKQAQTYLENKELNRFLEAKTWQAANLINAFKDPEAVPVLMDLVENYGEQLQASPQTALSVYWFLAHCHHIRQQRLPAIQYFEKWQQLINQYPNEDDVLNYQIYVEMSIAYNNMGRYQRSLEAAQKLLELSGKMNDVGKEMLAYNLMGESYLPLGDINKSLNSFDRLLEKDLTRLTPAQMNAEVRQYSIYLSNASYVASAHKDYPRALELIKRSLDHIEKQGDNPYSIYEKMAVLPNLSLAYDNLNHNDSALMAIEEVLAIVRSIPRHSFELPKILMQRGKIYAKMGNPQMAEQNFLEAIEVSNKFSRKTGIEVAMAHQLLGSLYRDQQKYDQALQQFQQSLTKLVPTFSESDPRSLPELTQVTAHKVELVSFLKDKASCWRLKHEQSRALEDLSSALDTYLMAMKLIDGARGKILDNQSRIALYENSQSLYEEALQVAADLYQETTDPRYLQAIFTAIEAKKANNLMDRFLDQRARQLVYIPDSLTTTENELKSLIAYYQREIYQAEFQQQADSAALSQLNKNLFDTEQQYEQHINHLASAYPAYQSYKQEEQELTLERLQKELLPKGNLALEFMWGEENIYLLALDYDQVLFQQIPRGDLPQLIPNYLEGLRSRSFDPQEAEQLANILMNNVLSKFKEHEHLTIFADGLLGYLPFETLMASEPGEGGSEFLINRFTINYHISAKLLGLPKLENAQVSKQSFLGYAPVFEKESNPLLASRSAENIQAVSELERLPQAEQEVKNIAGLLGGSYKLGAQATEADFKRSAHQSNIIHLASHAIVDDKNPLFSRLVFASSQDSLEDGLLHTYELYNIQLNADLACLSACNTGIGVYHQGEGIVSLAQGFLHAGVPNVMMSLWSVPDQSTAQIMLYFYEEIKNGQGKADALRQAKLRYLETADANTQDPYYWAAFTLIGDNQAIKDKGWEIWQMVLMALGMALMGFILYRLK